MRQPWRGCGGEGIAGGGARQTRGWSRVLLLPPQGVLLSGELLAETRGSRCRSAVASGGAAPGAPAEITAIASLRAWVRGGLPVLWVACPPVVPLRAVSTTRKGRPGQAGLPRPPQKGRSRCSRGSRGADGCSRQRWWSTSSTSAPRRKRERVLQASQRQGRDQVLEPCNQRRRWVCGMACEEAMGGAAQDPSQRRGAVKDPHRGPGPILEAAPQPGEAWAEPLSGNPSAGGKRSDPDSPQARPQPRTKGAPGPLTSGRGGRGPGPNLAAAAAAVRPAAGPRFAPPGSGG